MIDWDKFPNFSQSEFACSHCNKCEIRSEIVEIVQSIRTSISKPIFISSGYRCINHPIESMKDKPGEHSEGLAVDVICNGANAIEVIRHALSVGVMRIGVHQKGRSSSRYIHLGLGDRLSTYPSGIWTY